MAAPPRSQTIRPLATILISLLIAVALGTVLYALILAIGRDPLPGAETRFTLPELERPARPARVFPTPAENLQPLPELQAQISDRVTVPIQVTSVAPFLKDASAGVATFHSLTGGDFRWYPLSEALPGNEHSLLITSDAQVGSQLTITLAAKPEQARHGYLAQTTIEVTAANGRATPLVTLHGAAHDVAFNLPANVEQAGPLRLLRIDDQQWLPMLHSTSGLALRRGVTTKLKLGAGTYELQDPLAPERTQQFTVPGSAVVEVSETLAPARDDRP